MAARPGNVLPIGKALMKRLLWAIIAICLCGAVGVALGFGQGSPAQASQRLRPLLQGSCSEYTVTNGVDTNLDADYDGYYFVTYLGTFDLRTENPIGTTQNSYVLQTERTLAETTARVVLQTAEASVVVFVCSPGAPTVTLTPTNTATPTDTPIPPTVTPTPGPCAEFYNSTSTLPYHRVIFTVTAPNVYLFVTMDNTAFLVNSVDQGPLAANTTYTASNGDNIEARRSTNPRPFILYACATDPFPPPTATPTETPTETPTATTIPTVTPTPTVPPYNCYVAIALANDEWVATENGIADTTGYIFYTMVDTTLLSLWDGAATLGYMGLAPFSVNVSGVSVQNSGDNDASFVYCSPAPLTVEQLSYFTLQWQVFIGLLLAVMGGLIYAKR